MVQPAATPIDRRAELIHVGAKLMIWHDGRPL